tara:strand:- start:26746 stop:27207 length:462 start_codon:yes stop_codon:yes gene_type:complete
MIELQDKARSIVLLEFEKMKQDLISKHIELGMKASGKWIDSLEVTEEEMKVKLLGENYTDQLVYGRKNGTMPPVSAIEEWIRNKGITTNIPIRSLAWAIAINIKKNGTKYYQQGGTDLVSSVITPQRINKIINLVGEELTLLIIPMFLKRYYE